MAIVGRFRDLPAAEVASASLEAVGIGNSLLDTYMVGLDWTYSTALGWIRLYVADPDLQKAREALEPPSVIEWPSDIGPEDADERCSRCGTREIIVECGVRKTLALWLITYVPLWFWRSRLRCGNCGDSRLVPIRLRPELAASWLIAAVVAYLLTALVFLLAGYIIYGRT